MELFCEFYIDIKDYYLVIGDLVIELCFYYNLKKRYCNGKCIWGNFGGYLFVNFGYFFLIIIISGVKVVYIYVIIFYWGFCCVWKYFLFDLLGGVGYIGFLNGIFVVYLGLRIGLGYRFWFFYFNCRISN